MGFFHDLTVAERQGGKSPVPGRSRQPVETDFQTADIDLPRHHFIMLQPDTQARIGAQQEEMQQASGGIAMATGSVKWFDNAKGFGFVRPDTGGDDLFVHFSYVQAEGYRCLRAGQLVSFDLHATPAGFHAVNLRIIGRPSGKLHAVVDHPLQIPPSAGAHADP